MRVALISSKLGYVKRGFESFSRELFDRLQKSVDITLFKGAGERTKREVPVRCLRSEGGLLTRLVGSERKRMLYQERCYALLALPRLVREQFDVIVYSEAALGDVLAKARRFVGLRSVLVFSNGAPAPPRYYPGCDFIHQVHPVYFEQAVAAGWGVDRMAVVPYGVNAARFRPTWELNRAALRQKYGIPTERKVILCVAAIKSDHKRVDWLINEVARLSDEYFLIVAGQETDETQALRDLANDVLAERYMFISVAHKKIHELYHLSDVFALPSLHEGFGIVLLEAMAAGLPVLCHTAPVFKWICGDRFSLVDMTVCGALANRISQVLDAESARKKMVCKNRERVKTTFDWRVLQSKYVDMLHTALKRRIG